MTGEGTIANVPGATSTSKVADGGLWVAAMRASALMVVKSTNSTVANPASVAIAPPAMTTAQNDPRFLRTFVTTVLMASSDAFRRSGIYSHALIKNVIRDTQLRIPAL
jgi:hypothetical protein